LFHRNKKSEWSLEYDDSFYKVYDSAKRLAGYFFPDYDSLEKGVRDDVKLKGLATNLDDPGSIKLLNKIHAALHGGSLLLPMLKLDLLDNQSGITVDIVVNALYSNLRTAEIWKNWLSLNSNSLGIVGSLVYTAREDRNMLSILLIIKEQIILGEKEALDSLGPILNKLHNDGLL
jgi:hypothetical protein